MFERLFELQHVKTPVFLKMHELLEEKKNLPSTLPDGFKQVSDLIGEIIALSFFFLLKSIHGNNSHADLRAEELGVLHNGGTKERREH